MSGDLLAFLIYFLNQNFVLHGFSHFNDYIPDKGGRTTFRVTAKPNKRKRQVQMEYLKLYVDKKMDGWIDG